MNGQERRDMRRTWRILLAVVLPLGPLGVLVTRAAMPYWTNQNNPEIVERMAAAPIRSEITVWAFGLTHPALVLGPLVIAYLARRRAPRLATWGAILAFLGYGMGAQIGNSDLLMVALAKDGYDSGLMADVTASVAAHPLSGVGIGIFIIGHILGMVLLGLALVRAGLVPTWAGAALAVSQPFHLVSAVLLPSRLLDLTLGWGLTVIAFAMVSRTLLRLSDEEFDTAAGAPEPARPSHGPSFAAPSA